MSSLPDELETWTEDMSVEVASTKPNFRTHVLSKTNGKKILALHSISPEYLQLLSQPELVELANKVATDICLTDPKTPQAASTSSLEETIERLLKLGVNKKNNSKQQQQQAPPAKDEGPKVVTTPEAKVEDKSQDAKKHAYTGGNAKVAKAHKMENGSEDTKSNTSSPKPSIMQQDRLSSSPMSILKVKSSPPCNSNQPRPLPGPRALKDVNSPLKDKTISLRPGVQPTPKELAKGYRQQVLSRLNEEQRNYFHPGSYSDSDHALNPHHRPTSSRVHFALSPTIQEFDGNRAPNASWEVNVEDVEENVEEDVEEEPEGVDLEELSVLHLLVIRIMEMGFPRFPAMGMWLPQWIRDLWRGCWN